MLKYLQPIKDQLSGLKAGISNNAAAWAGQTDTPLTVQAEIDQMNQADNEIELLKAQLKQKQMAVRKLAAEKKAAAEAIEKKAIGIHAASTGKLAEYNISLPKGPGAARPLPAKAVIKRIENDKDGIGFRIAMQSQGTVVDFWELERGELVPTTDQEGSVPLSEKPTHGATTVLQPPYPFLKSTKRLVYVDDAVKFGVRYFYRVRGVNATGEGAWSQPVSAVQ